MLKAIFFSLFVHISIGLVFTILFISKEEVGRLYFRVTTLVAFTLIVVALLSQPFGNINALQIMGVRTPELSIFERLTYLLLILTSILLVFYNLIYPRVHKLTLSIIFLLGMLAIANHVLAGPQPKNLSLFEKALFVFNAIASALILGSVLGAMITGHWYLVKHKLSLNPLKNSSKIYLLSVFFRILVIGFTIIAFSLMDKIANPLRLFSGVTFDGVLFLARVAIGLAIPLVFGFMICGTVKIRSTQSATGILYATLIMILIGEVFGQFLSNLIGIPL